MSHCAIYVRVSTRHQAEDGFSLDEQRETLVAMAEQRGGTYEVYEDAGISGETLHQRPEMMRLLKAVERGEIDCVLVADESRLARDELVAATIRHHLKVAGVTLATPGRGEFNLADPSDNFIANVLAGAHALEQDMRTAKMKAGHRKTAEAGFWTGGPAPYGYALARDPQGSKHKVLVINEAEAAVLRRVAALVTSGEHSTYSVAALLNAEGVRNREGGLWRHPNLCQHLRQSRLIGTSTYDKKGLAIERSNPPILTPEEWQQLQDAIKGKPRPQRRNRVYPLTGRGRVHLRCSCGANYSGLKDTGKSFHQYQCSRKEVTFGEDRCSHRPYRVPGPALEDAVIEKLQSVLTEAYLLDLAREHVERNSDPRTSKNEAEALRRRVVALENQAETIILTFGETEHAESALRALDKIKQETKELNQQLAEIERRAELQIEWASIEDQIRSLVATATKRLASPTPEEKAELVDAFDLDLVRVGNHRYEGTASIPLLAGEPRNENDPTPGSAGEVCTEVPPPL